MKRILKLTTAALVIGGVSVAILGRPRAEAVLTEARTVITDLVDGEIDRRTELMAQLEGLRTKLPKELDALRAEKLEIEAEADTVRRERTVARRVVELATADAESLNAKVASAAVIAAEYPGSPLAAVDAKRNQQRLTQARLTAAEYASAAEEHDVHLALLESQLEQLAGLITEREAEYAAFQVQASRLESEVAAIERNEKLIAWCEARETSRRPESKYEAASLDELLSNFEHVRSEQSDTLARLTTRSNAKDYERTARREASLGAVADAR